MRDKLGGGKAIIPSAKKRAAPGATIDIPLHFKDAAFVHSHVDPMELMVPDAPHADEIVLAIALTNGGRPLARVGGLRKEEVEGKDGLK
jgi:hypothetical protein